MSQAFARLGAAVTIIDTAPQILPERTPGATSGPAAGATGGAAAIHGRVRRIFLTTGSGEEVIEADEILLAVGRRGNSAGLGLDIGGVELDGTFA